MAGLLNTDLTQARSKSTRLPVGRVVGTSVNRDKKRGQSGQNSGPFTGHLDKLLEEVLEIALLLLGLTLPLVRAALPLRALVAREGTAGFLHAALGPVHRSFVLVVPAAGHGVSSSSSRL
jgi:hypothetical protein